MKSIFSYKNYRTFLRDFYAEKKVTTGYTYRDFARAAGMNSSSWLMHLIRGTKNLSNDSIATVARVLELNRQETGYFELLVHFNQAKTSSVKDYFFQKLLAFGKPLAEATTVDEQQYEYYTKWHHPVIRSLVSKVDWDGDYRVLARKVVPPVTAAQAKESVKLLKRLGLIRKVRRAGWVQTDAAISTGDEVQSLHVANYHKQMSDIAKDALDNCPRELRDISSLTMGVGPEDVETIKRRIREFRKEIMQVVSQSRSQDRVYQLNFQFFPVSKADRHANT